MTKNNPNVLLVTILVAVISSAATAYFVVNSIPEKEKTQEELIQEFYDVETAVHVSPHGLRKHIDEGQYIIVDLRSQEEYETAHVVGALSVPAYATPDKSDYGAVDRIVGSFKEIQAENPGTPIVVYCYSGPCMTGRKIGKMLADHEIYVEHLGIGWSEWRYYWNMWNHDGETGVNPEDYIASGPEPGVFEGDYTGGACPIEGDFGC
ncbi:rhodanese-like domain-containing protein [Candidatus Woesearchaeota archaeon]|nr:rhodanese-like domain-containing protein [Candidatus Woesearchaeota archaeon]